MPDYQVLSRRRCYEGWAKLDEVELTQEGLDQPVKRLIVECGDAAAVLLHDARKRRFLMVRQLRIPLERHGQTHPLELVAGEIDEGENPEDAARRETLEEVGHAPKQILKVADIFPSPGIISEKVSIFYAEIDPESRVHEGDLDEGETLEHVWIPVDEAFALLDQGDVMDAKSTVALLWFRLQNLQQKSPA